ncbi:MAG TPA: outer membrane protein assembly factor BamD [Candidatus Acidoferrum sp.]
MALCVMGALFLLGATTSSAQITEIFHKKKKLDKSTGVDNNAQPDKILYDKAIDDIKHGRQEVGRLNMQTLINTYPDSEYLAKAKLAIADSYYKEGGTSNMALAISGYKDFGVFFPFLPEATYAQMQVAMAHYKQLEKPDRDRSHAVAAEEEFQTFLQKYPNDPLASQAQQHLREVQEVLAEGDYRIGYYYYVKGDKRAAAARLLAVTNRYPLYSRSDRALWMMGDILESSEHKEVAAVYYARIVKNYPLSSMVPGAKEKLKAFGAPVPQPDPNALAWMTAEQNAPRSHTPLIKKPLQLIKNGPTDELQVAAKTGAPNMQPESDTFSPADILRPGGKSGVGAGTGLVATITPGTASGAGTTAASENVAPAGTEATTPDAGAAPPATTEAPKDAATPTPAPVSPAASDAAAKPAPTADGAAEAPAGAKTDAAAAGAEAKSDSTSTETKSDSTDAAKAGDSQTSADPKKESSSKKKKGIRKIVPW